MKITITKVSFEDNTWEKNKVFVDTPEIQEFVKNDLVVDV